MKSITLETMIRKMAVNFRSDLLNPENGKENEKKKKGKRCFRKRGRIGRAGDGGFRR